MPHAKNASNTTHAVSLWIAPDAEAMLLKRPVPRRQHDQVQRPLPRDLPGVGDDQFRSIPADVQPGQL